MIARVWRGWAGSVENADLYQDFLRSTFLPSIHGRLTGPTAPASAD